MTSLPQHVGITHDRLIARSRSGLSLFEVILAIAILGASYTALAQLFSVGRMASVQAAHEVEALTRAESLLAEIEAGLRSMEAVNKTQFIDPVTEVPEEGWYWQVDIFATGLESMNRLVVTVWHENTQQARTATVQLARLVVDQSLLIPESASLTEEE